MDDRNSSILTSIKTLLGVEEDYAVFDTEIIMAINTAFSILRDLGVGPENGFSIDGPESKWSDYITNWSGFEDAKTFIHLKVKMIFDPSQSSTLNAVYDNLIKELEWRICSRSDRGGDTNESND